MYVAPIPPVTASRFAKGVVYQEGEYPASEMARYRDVQYFWAQERDAAPIKSKRTAYESREEYSRIKQMPFGQLKLFRRYIDAASKDMALRSPNAATQVGGGDGNVSRIPTTRTDLQDPWGRKIHTCPLTWMTWSLRAAELMTPYERVGKEEYPRLGKEGRESGYAI